MLHEPNKEIKNKINNSHLDGWMQSPFPRWPLTYTFLVNIITLFSAHLRKRSQKGQLFMVEKRLD